MPTDKKLPRRKTKQKLNSLTKFVIFSLAMVITYTGVVTVLTATTSYDYGTIYTVFCSIFGGEILCSALIKIFKLKSDDNDIDNWNASN